MTQENKPKSEYTWFRCPKCGSTRWGTSHVTEPFEKWIGHCHGWACKFTWNRATQDKDVFVPDRCENSPTPEGDIEEVVAVVKLPMPMGGVIGLMKGLIEEFGPGLLVRNCPEGYEIFRRWTINPQWAMENKPHAKAMPETAKTSMYPNGTCHHCGSRLIGDGYRNVLHCENADPESYEHHEPDAPPVFCEDKLSREESK